jgi:hypothetical protein
MRKGFMGVISEFDKAKVASVFQEQILRPCDYFRTDCQPDTQSDLGMSKGSVSPLASIPTPCTRRVAPAP